MWSGADCLEALAEQSEINHLDGARRPARRLTHERRYTIDSGIRKDRSIKLSGLLLLCVPEVRKDLCRLLRDHHSSALMAMSLPTGIHLRLPYLMASVPSDTSCFKSATYGSTTVGRCSFIPSCEAAKPRLSSAVRPWREEGVVIIKPSNRRSENVD